MKLCFSTLSAPAWDIPQIITAAHEYGLTGVDFRGLGEEIDITRLPQFNERLNETLAQFGAAGVSVPCLQTSVTLVSPAPERWQMMLEECQRYARLASRMGTPYLRIFGGAVQKGMSFDESRLMAHRHLRQLIKICKSTGCMPLLETHDDWTTHERILGLLHEFSPEEAGVLWDLENSWRSGEKHSDTAHMLRKFIRHVHVKDSLPLQGKMVPRLLGEGDVPLSSGLAALRSIDYQGWYCLETEKRRHPQEAPEPQESLPVFVRYMTGYLKTANSAH